MCAAAAAHIEKFQKTPTKFVMKIYMQKINLKNMYDIEKICFGNFVSLITCKIQVIGKKKIIAYCIKTCLK